MLDDVKFDDYDLLGITQHLIKIDAYYGLWALPAMEATYMLMDKRDKAIDLHGLYKNPLKYIGEIVSDTAYAAEVDTDMPCRLEEG